jgi:hypothetical protein
VAAVALLRGVFSLADNGEIVAGATGLGALLGGFWAAWKSFKPAPAPEKEEASMSAWMQQVNATLADHKARLERAEIDRKEDREDFGLVFAELKKLGQSNARIEGALGIGSDGR